MPESQEARFVIGTNKRSLRNDLPRAARDLPSHRINYRIAGKSIREIFHARDHEEPEHDYELFHRELRVSWTRSLARDRRDRGYCPSIGQSQIDSWSEIWNFLLEIFTRRPAQHDSRTRHYLLALKDEALKLNFGTALERRTLNVIEEPTNNAFECLSVSVRVQLHSLPRNSENEALKVLIGVRTDLSDILKTRNRRLKLPGLRHFSLCYQGDGHCPGWSNIRLPAGRRQFNAFFAVFGLPLQSPAKVGLLRRREATVVATSFDCLKDSTDERIEIVFCARPGHRLSMEHRKRLACPWHFDVQYEPPRRSVKDAGEDFPTEFGRITDCACDLR